MRLCARKLQALSNIARSTSVCGVDDRQRHTGVEVPDASLAARWMRGREGLNFRRQEEPSFVTGAAPAR